MQRDRQFMVYDPLEIYPVYKLVIRCQKPGQARWWSVAAMMGIGIGQYDTVDDEALVSLAETLVVLEIDMEHNQQIVDGYVKNRRQLHDEYSRHVRSL